MILEQHSRSIVQESI